MGKFLVVKTITKDLEVEIEADSVADVQAILNSQQAEHLDWEQIDGNDERITFIGGGN